MSTSKNLTLTVEASTEREFQKWCKRSETFETRTTRFYQMFEELPFFQPERAHDSAAGVDIGSAENVTIKPYQQIEVQTNTGVVLAEGTCGIIKTKSSTARKMVRVEAGVIDRGYNGQLFVMMYNYGIEPFVVETGDKICQMVIQKIEVDGHSSDRGDKGFGSTGKKLTRKCPNDLFERAMEIARAERIEAQRAVAAQAKAAADKAAERVKANRSGYGFGGSSEKAEAEKFQFGGSVAPEMKKEEIPEKKKEAKSSTTSGSFGGFGAKPTTSGKTGFGGFGATPDTTSGNGFGAPCNEKPRSPSFGTTSSGGQFGGFSKFGGAAPKKQLFDGKSPVRGPTFGGGCGTH